MFAAQYDRVNSGEVLLTFPCCCPNPASVVFGARDDGITFIIESTTEYAHLNDLRENLHSNQQQPNGITEVMLSGRCRIEAGSSYDEDHQVMLGLGKRLH